MEVETEHSVPRLKEVGLRPRRRRRVDEPGHERHRGGQVEVVGDRRPEARVPLLPSRRFIFVRLRGPLRDSISQLPQGAVRPGHAFRAEVERGPVLRLQGEIPKRERVEPLLLQLGDAEEVARRFRHPRARKHEQPAVHPEADHTMPGHRLGLRDLGLVMRKHVVRAACMDVEPLAEDGHRHRRALDVPAGISRAPWARPRLEAILARCSPEREVAGVALERIRFAPMTRHQLFG